MTPNARRWSRSRGNIPAPSGWIATAKVVRQIAALISAANEISGDGFLPHDPAWVRLNEMTFEFEGAGAPARLLAIMESYNINDVNVRLTVVLDLIAGSLHPEQRLDSEALTVLAASGRAELLECLCLSAHVFATHVPRTELRQALVTAWREADGVMKENLEYVLRREGFTKMRSMWI